MIYQFRNDLVFVKGSYLSAIYDFATEKVYSLNIQATEILQKLINSSELSTDELSFIERIKTIFNLDEITPEIYKGIAPKNTLNFAWLELTGRCNCKCIQCYQGQKHEEPLEVLKYNDWKKILKQISDLNCKSIQFIGGEPSLCKFLPDLIGFAKSIGIDNISVFSNINYLSSKLIRSIIDYNVHIHFSIYGSTSLVHDSITNTPGSFNNMVKNLNILLHNNVIVTPHIVIMKQNEHDKSNIYSFLNSYGITDIKYDEIRKVKGIDMSHLLLSSPTSVMHSPNFKCSKDYFDKAMFCNTCWHGKIVISPNGNVYPCEFERNITYGNILENSIKTIINSKDTIRYWQLSFDKVTRCKDCEFRYACKDCRPICIAESGNLFDTSPRCAYNPYKGIWN